MMDPMMAMGMPDPSGPGGGGGPGQGGSTIPHFSKAGTALSQKERQKIADKRGVCLTCETKTHTVGVFGKKPLTNDDVFRGACIRCNGNAVPPNVLSEWQARNQQQAPTAAVTTAAAAARPSGIGRFRAAGHVVGMAATAGHHHNHPNSNNSVRGSNNTNSSMISSSQRVSTFPPSAVGASGSSHGSRDSIQVGSDMLSGSGRSNLGGSGRSNPLAFDRSDSSSGATGVGGDGGTNSFHNSFSNTHGLGDHGRPSPVDVQRMSSLQPGRMSTIASSPPNSRSGSNHDRNRYPAAPRAHSPKRSDYRNMRSESSTLPSRSTTVPPETTMPRHMSMQPQSDSPGLLNQDDAHEMMHQSFSMNSISEQAARISEQRDNMSRSTLLSSDMSKSHLMPHRVSYKTSKCDEGKDHATLLLEIQDSRSNNNPEELTMKLHAYRNLLQNDDTATIANNSNGSDRPEVDMDAADHDHTHVIDVMTQVCEILYATTNGTLTPATRDPDENESLFVAATSLLWRLCMKDEWRKHQAVEIGCLDPLINILTDERPGSVTAEFHPESIAQTIGTLSVLAEAHDIRLLISQRGGIERIVQNLAKHETDPSVFEWACKALIVIASSDYDDETAEHRATVEHNIAVIVEAGGVAAVASSMKYHTIYPVAEWNAFRLLACMVNQRNDSPVDNVISQMVESNMHRICVDILKARPTTTDLLIVTCEFLRMLCDADSSKLSGTECASSVLRALGEKSSSVDLKASGIHLLATTARNNNSTKKLISENSTFRGLVNGLSSKLDHLHFVRVTLMLLCVLSCDESSFDYSLLEPIRNVTESIYRKYPDNSELNGLICNFVANNANISQAQPECVAMNVVSGIIKKETANDDPNIDRAFSVIISHASESVNLLDQEESKRFVERLGSSNVNIQISTSSTLSRIVSHSELARDNFFAAGGVTQAIATLMSTESEILARSLLELISACVTNTSKKAVQLPNDICTSILRTINKFPSLNQTGLITIRNAMLKSAPGFHVCTDGLAQTLSSILDDTSYPDSVIVEACDALWACCTKSLFNGGELSQVYSSCIGLCSRNRGEGDATPFNAVVLTEAAGALSAILHCAQDIPIDIKDEEVDLIISVLDLGIEFNVENFTLMSRMLDSIMSLCFIAKDVMIQYGVIVVVIDCMVEHEHNEEIQQKGCGILALLASAEDLQIILSIAETDGIDMLVSALSGFSKNSRIQTDACRALSHLSIDQESRMLISSQGGLILIVNAMTNFPDDVDVLEAACGALLNLSSDAQEQVLLSSTVIETVITPMKHHVLSEKLLEKCLGVIQNVSMRSKNSKKYIADAGGIGSITVVLKEFIGSPSVVERAFTALWSLAVLEENQVRISNENGIGLVINAMMANVMFGKVQKQACGCLCTLSSNAENKTRIRAQGGVDAIVYAMWAHYDSDDVLAEACRALSSLAVNVKTSEVMIASEGEISAIMSSMRRFPSSERLQEHACVALRNFMLSSDNASLVRHQQHELEELVQAASARFPDKCSARSQQLLDILRSTSS